MYESIADNLKNKKRTKAFIRFIWVKAFLCLTICSFGQEPSSLHLDQKISKAKSLPDKTQQIQALQELLAQAQEYEYLDTLAQIHYALAYRFEYEQKNQSDWAYHSRECIKQSELANWHHYSYSRCLRYIGDYHEQREQLDSALYYYQKVPDYPSEDWQYYQSVAMSYNRSAIIYQEQYQLWEAINTLDLIQQDTIWPFISEDDQGNILLTQAICYSSLQDKQSLEKSIDLVKASIASYVAYDDEALLQEHQARSFLILGNAYYQLKNYPVAIEYYSDVLEMDHQLYDDTVAENNQYQAEINLTNVYLARNDIENARASILLAEQRYDKQGSSWDDYEAYVLANNQLSVLAFGENQDEFRNTFEEIITPYLKPRTSVLQLVNYPQKKRIINLLLEYVNGLENFGDTDAKSQEEQLFYLSQVDSVFFMYLGEVALDKSRYFWKEQMAPAYRKGADIAYQLGRIKELWHFGEKQKSRYLYQLLAQKNNRASEDLRLLRAKADNLYIELKFGSTGKADSISLSNQIATIRADILAKYQMLDKNTLWDAFSYDGWDELQRETKTVVSYVSGERQLYRLTNLNGNIQSEDIGSVEKIAKLTIEYITGLKEPTFDSQFEEIRASISQILLPSNLPTSASLLIIPDESLSYLPFCSLKMKIEPYLIQKHSLSQQLSYAVYKHLSSNSSKTSEPVIISPNYDKAPALISATVTRSDALEDLPYAKKEAENISKLLNTNIYKKTDPENFRSLYEQAHILHFTGHAVQFPEEASLAYLALSSEQENLRMAARDISHMKSTSALVSLSACATYSGKRLTGEGIFGLSRAFIQSGTSSVLSTLWELQDESGMKIMEEFYRQLVQNQTNKDQALQHAQLKYLQQAPDHLRHPYYWAGFNLTGNCYPLPSRKSILPKWSILTAILVCGFYTIRYFIKKSRQNDSRDN